MESHGTSWADQWDPQPDLAPAHAAESKRDKYSKKVGSGFDRTKVAAAGGAKKVKHGATLGFNWIKDKCHKLTQKH